MSQENNGKKLSEIIAKCWADENFKRKLLADPIVVLNGEGVTINSDVNINVVENTENHFTLVIPAKPTDLSDADLDRVAGGSSYCELLTGPMCYDFTDDGGKPNLCSGIDSCR